MFWRLHVQREMSAAGYVSSTCSGCTVLSWRCFHFRHRTINPTLIFCMQGWSICWTSYQCLDPRSDRSRSVTSDLRNATSVPVKSAWQLGWVAPNPIWDSVLPGSTGELQARFISPPCQPVIFSTWWWVHLQKIKQKVLPSLRIGKSVPARPSRERKPLLLAFMLYEEDCLWYKKIIQIRGKFVCYNQD